MIVIGYVTIVLGYTGFQSGKENNLGFIAVCFLLSLIGAYREYHKRKWGDIQKFKEQMQSLSENTRENIEYFKK